MKVISRSFPLSLPVLTPCCNKVEQTARGQITLLRNIAVGGALIAFTAQPLHALIIPLSILATCFHFMRRCIAEIDTLHGENKLLQTTRLQLSEEVCRLSSELGRLEHQTLALHRIRDALQERVHDFEHTNDRIRQEVQNLDGIRREISRLTDEINRLNAEHARLLNEQRTATESLHNLHREFRNTTLDLARVRSALA